MWSTGNDWWAIPPVKPSVPILLQDLADELSSELSGNFRSVVLGLLMLAPVYDAYELKTAMKVRVSHVHLSLGDKCSDCQQITLKMSREKNNWIKILSKSFYAPVLVVPEHINQTHRFPVWYVPVLQWTWALWFIWVSPRYAFFSALNSQ